MIMIRDENEMKQICGDDDCENKRRETKNVGTDDFWSLRQYGK
jgi:hypothetical protein